LNFEAKSVISGLPNTMKPKVVLVQFVPIFRHHKSGSAFSGIFGLTVDWLE